MAEGGSIGRWVTGIIGTVIAGVLVAVIVNALLSNDNGNGGSSGGDSGTTTTTTLPSTTTTTTTTTSLPSTTTTLPPTFLEQLRGTWTLIDWRERPADPVTLGMDVLEGTLVFDSIGHAFWDLDLDDGGPAPAITPGVRCLGVVDQGSQALEGLPGRLVVDGEDLIGIDRDWTSNLLSLRGDASVAFCGWTFEPESNLFVYDTTSSAYALELSTAADDAQTLLLMMRNAAGTFTWQKVA